MSDQASHARWAGRHAKAEATVWDLTIGDLRIRCVHSSPGFDLEVRDLDGWANIGSGQDPAGMLTRLLTAKNVQLAIADRSKP